LIESFITRTSEKGWRWNIILCQVDPRLVRGAGHWWGTGKITHFKFKDSLSFIYSLPPIWYPYFWRKRFWCKWFNQNFYQKSLAWAENPRGQWNTSPPTFCQRGTLMLLSPSTLHSTKSICHQVQFFCLLSTT